MTTDSGEGLAASLLTALGSRVVRKIEALDEVTVEIRASDLIETMRILRDHPALKFEQLIDLCGVDYSAYRDGAWESGRFAVVYHLLSISKNRRIRVRIFVPETPMLLVSSVNDIWPSANWFEREAFDLYGIIFDGHPDLRRILTDYGFVGHPFRKDFPISGHVEMRYDEATRRVVYQPVSIPPREITPRIVREPHYGEV